MNREQIKATISNLERMARGEWTKDVAPTEVARQTLTLLRGMKEVIYGDVVEAFDDLDNAAKGNAVVTNQPKTCPGCGGEMRGNEMAYPCGRKPELGSPETTQCVRYQLFDARVNLADIREVAGRLAKACQTEHLLALLQYIGGGQCVCDPSVGAAPCETCVAKLAETCIGIALDEFRKAVKS